MMRLKIGLVASMFCVIAASPGFASEGERYLYMEGFESGLAPGWTVANDNGDTYTWETRNVGGARNSPAVFYLSNPTLAADDWLFSSPFSLAAATTHTLHFKHRVTSSADAHRLEVWIGTGASATSMTAQLRTLTPTSSLAQETSVSFQAVGAGANQVIGFHCTSDPNRLALYLDDVVVGRAENDLRAVLQLDKFFYEGSVDYLSTEPVASLTWVENLSTTPLTVDGFLSLGHFNHPQSILSFLLTGPDGQLVPFQMRYRLPIPDDDDFRVLQQGDSVYKYYDLNSGPFDLSTSGTYTVRAVYRNIHPMPGGGDPWRGQLVSDPVIFRIGGGL